METERKKKKKKRKAIPKMTLTKESKQLKKIISNLKRRIMNGEMEGEGREGKHTQYHSLLIVARQLSNKSAVQKTRKIYSPKVHGTRTQKDFNVSTQNVFVRNKITKQLSWIIAVHFAAVLSNGRAMKTGWHRTVYRTCIVPADCLPCRWLLTSHGRRYAMTLMQNLKLSILAYLSY